MVSEILPGQDFQGQGHYGKVKGQIKAPVECCTPTPHNKCPCPVSTSYPYSFPDIAWSTTRSKVKSKSYHDIAYLHPQPMSLPSTNLLHLKMSEMDKILNVKVTTARSKIKSRLHHDINLHPQPMSITSINFLHLTVSEI